MIEYTEKDGAVIFNVRVIPRASRTGIVGEHDGALKIKTAAPPVDGAANNEVIRVLAKVLDVPKSNVIILSGETSKLKRISVSGVSGDRVSTL